MLSESAELCTSGEFAERTDVNKVRGEYMNRYTSMVMKFFSDLLIFRPSICKCPVCKK